MLLSLMLLVVQEEEELSPIEEVNLTVSTKDDPSLQALTIRTWVIGVVICVFLSFVNQFFWFRSSPFIISALAGQILSLYIGRFLARVVPDWKIGPVSLNPGPFNIKVGWPIRLPRGMNG